MKIVIIGNGIAGSTAARYLRKYSTQDVLMISDEADYPFSRTALMYIYMGHLKAEHTKLYEDHFWKDNSISLLKGKVKSLDTVKKIIELENSDSISYDTLIIATGSKPNFFGWPGQNLKGVQGLYHMHDLESLEQTSTNIKHAAIIGGGLIGIELAEMLHSRHIPVSFLVRETSFWNAVLPPEESAMINKEIRDHGIDLRLGEELKEMVDDGSGRVKAIITSKDSQIACELVGITVGVSPNIEFVKQSGIECNRGVLVNENLQTSVSNIYAIGDCAELRAPNAGRRNIEAIWYTGKQMGITVAKNIVQENTAYNPNLWYNSAKFFTIEYQVYGDVPVNPSESISTLYWQADNQKKSIRINFDKNTTLVKGFLLMGIRYRHEVCEKWILENTSIESVLSNLSLANFDPEFYTEYEQYLLNVYQTLTGNAVIVKAKRNLNQVINFLKS